MSRKWLKKFNMLKSIQSIVNFLQIHFALKRKKNLIINLLNDILTVIIMCTLLIRRSKKACLIYDFPEIRL